MGDRPTRDLERQGGTTGPLNRDEFPNYINPLPFSRIRSRPPPHRPPATVYRPPAPPRPDLASSHTRIILMSAGVTPLMRLA